MKSKKEIITYDSYYYNNPILDKFFKAWIQTLDKISPKLNINIWEMFKEADIKSNLSGYTPDELKILTTIPNNPTLPNLEKALKLWLDIYNFYCRLEINPCDIKIFIYGLPIGVLGVGNPAKPLSIITETIKFKNFIQVKIKENEITVPRSSQLYNFIINYVPVGVNLSVTFVKKK